MNRPIGFDELKAYIGFLDEPQRAELASLLLGSLPSDPEVPDPSFTARLTRRIEELRSGKAQGISAKDAFASLDR